MQEQLKTHDHSIKDLQDPLRRSSSTLFQREAAVAVSGQIFIFGGYPNEASQSFEVFNWSTKTWTLAVYFIKGATLSRLLTERK